MGVKNGKKKAVFLYSLLPFLFLFQNICWRVSKRRARTLEEGLQKRGVLLIPSVSFLFFFRFLFKLSNGE